MKWLSSKDPDEDLRDEGAAEPEPVALPITHEIDLHSFLPRDIPAVVRDYLNEAQAAGLRELRIIHGKGIGYQRKVVQDVLATSPLVASFADAPPEMGGRGATLVLLKPQQ